MGTTGTIVPAGVGAANAVPHAPRTVMETIQRPRRGTNGVWLDFVGVRWYSSGTSASYSANRFTKVGEYRGFPVYVEPVGSIRIRSGCRSRIVDHSHPTRGASRLFDFPRPVWLLGWVSLATDSATEAIYPLLPFFLTRVLGAGAVSLGVLEGAAEAVNSILKIVSGRLADRSPRKRPLVLFGYGISSIARPFIALAATWTQVFIVRVLDRVGKGVRGAPRDAMLAVWTTPGLEGRYMASIAAWTTSAPSWDRLWRLCSCGSTRITIAPSSR